MTGSRLRQVDAESASVASAGVVHNLNPPRGRVLLTERPARWREAVVDRLVHINHLPMGWDGYGAGPIDFRVCEFTLRMIQSICGPDAPTPSIVPGVNGDLQVEWHSLAGDIELHVLGPSNVCAWRATTETDDGGEEIMLTVDFASIVPWIKELTEQASAAVFAAA